MGDKILRILVIESDFINSMYISKVLEMNSYKYTIAADGEEAVKILSNNKFDLIITRVALPRMNGIILLKLIRNGSIPNTDPNIPVIVSTGYASREAYIKINEYHPDVILIKPYLKKDLDAAIQKASKKLLSEV